MQGWKVCLTGSAPCPMAGCCLGVFWLCSRNVSWLFNVEMYFVSGTEQGTHEKKLLNKLLERYNVLERPVANESEPLEVKFGLTLQQIIDVVS